MIIAISGTRCVGKDTVFLNLQKILNVERFAFADALKQDLETLVKEQFNIDIYNPKSAADKEFIRPLLIAYGCMWRERDPEHWVKKVIQAIKQLDISIIPVIVDVRFENELDELLKYYGKDLIHINVTNTLAPPPTETEELHYRMVAIRAPYEIHWGDNTEEEQAQKVQSIFDVILNDIVGDTHSIQ